jgi:hypothetical protein
MRLRASRFLLVAFQSRSIINPLNMAGDAVDGLRNASQIVFDAKGHAS